MRGRFAAACAAILVGLSPAGALPFARIAAVAVARASHRSEAVRTARFELQPRRAAQQARAAQQLVAPTSRIAVLGDPSGPLPAQAPPAV
jgi:hypothetical protein